MMNGGRIFHKGEKPSDVFNNYHGANKYNKYFYERIGEVLEIDYDRYRMKIRWADGSGAPSWMPISFAYAGPSGCLGMIPEEHAIGIFSFYNEGQGKGSPIGVSFLPTALAQALEYNTVKINPDQISNEDENLIRYKFRPLTDGDMNMSSPLGGNVFVNKNVEIGDELHDSILIRSSDQSIIQTSLNNFIFSDGVAVYAGPIIRNDMSLFDSDGKRIENTNGRETTLSDGRDCIYSVPFGKRIEYDTKFFSEYRIDASEICDGILDENDINGYTSTSTRDPIVRLVMGNYVGTANGNNGVILRPVLFKSRSDDQGSFYFVQCSQKKGVDEPSKLGLAYALHCLKSGAFMGLDKEGHYHLYLPASITHPLGAGRSMSILADGNLKEIWGMSADDNNSWDLTAKGGIRWDVGNHNSVSENRSIDIRTSSGVYYEYGGADESKFAKQERVLGPSTEFVGGKRTEEVSGNYELTVDGLKTETIRGAASSTYSADKSINVSGIYNEIVVKEKQAQYGKRKVTVSGDDELTIVKGNLTQTILGFGNKKTTLQGAGSIEESILTGNRKISIKAGNYDLKVSSGQVNIKTSLGTVTVKGTTVEVEGTASVTVKGIKVYLGGGSRGGVVTGQPGVPSHLDYVTGVPLKGAMTVSAGS